MAKADQKVTSPNPGYLFLWSFFFVLAIFLSAHHWHYSIKKKVLPFQPQAKLTEKLPSRITVTQQKGQQGLTRITGPVVLADQIPT